jgi:hypothetical protein
VTDSTDTTYNGWSNYPTWAVNLWLDNDRGLYEERNERVSAIVAETVSRSPKYWTLAQSHLYATEDMLKEWVADLAADEYEEPTMVADLIGYALGEVNWREIAEHLVDAVSEVQA